MRSAAIAFVLFSWAAAPSPAFAEASRAGAWSGDYLLLGVSARASGMGDAFVAVTGDPANLYWNPAGLPSIDRFGIQAQYNLWLDGLKHDYISFVAPMDHIVADMWGGVGISYATIQSGDVQRTLEDADGNYYTDKTIFAAGETVFTMGYGGQVTQTFSAGTNIKLVNQKMDNSSATTAVVDIGALSKSAVNGLTGAVLIQNIGGKFAGGALPLTGKLGGAYEIQDAPFLGSMLMFTADVWLGFLSTDNRPKANVGAEYRIEDGGDGPGGKEPPHTLAVRAGYRVNHYWYDPMDGLSVGGGMAVAIAGGSYGGDYAWSPHGAFGPTHRITLTAKF